MSEVPARLTALPDRLKWNERYSAPGYVPSFKPHDLAVRALSGSRPLAPDAPSLVPEGPVLELACGPSGSALLAASTGLPVTAVDASDVALDLLAREAGARGLADLLTVVLADLRDWRPDAGRYALVLCTGYWDREIFAAAAGAVREDGVLAWEALTLAARLRRPELPPDWCLQAGQPASLLPDQFAVLSQADVGPALATRRRLLARRSG